LNISDHDPRIVDGVREAIPICKENCPIAGCFATAIIAVTGSVVLHYFMGGCDKLVGAGRRQQQQWTGEQGQDSGTHEQLSSSG
jgi:hypothetical protein